MTKNEQGQTIAALLEERRGYVVRGLDDRVALVDAKLREIGHQAAKPSSRAERRPSSRSRSGKR